jgi:hypothetical protein
MNITEEQFEIARREFVHAWETKNADPLPEPYSIRRGQRTRAGLLAALATLGIRIDGTGSQ